MTHTQGKRNGEGTEQLRENKINFGRRIRERQEHLRRRGINSQAKGPDLDETLER